MLTRLHNMQKHIQKRTAGPHSGELKALDTRFNKAARHRMAIQPKERPKQARSTIGPTCGITIGALLRSIPLSGDTGGLPCICCRLAPPFVGCEISASCLWLGDECKAASFGIWFPRSFDPHPSSWAGEIPKDSCEHKSIRRNRSLCRVQNVQSRISHVGFMNTEQEFDFIF